MAESIVLGSSLAAHGPSEEASIIEEENIEEDPHWDLRDLMSKGGRRPSTLQQIQELCRSYGLFVPTAVRSV